MRLAALALLLLLSAVPTHAEPSLTPGGDASVRDVIDGATLDLADGRQLRLAGIEPPAQGALARTTKAALAELVASGVITLRFAGNPQDRQGRVVAQVYAGTVWIEGELVKRGLARVRY
jgi:micrococcal nuclease